jgi:long-chain acyl-CoA synthetase
MANITDTYDKHALHSSEKNAIVTMDESISFRDWNEKVGKTANWLQSLLLENKTVGICLPNGIPFLQIFAGASKIGWITVLFDPKWKLSEIEKRLRISQPSILITTRKMLQQINHLHPHIIALEDCLLEINKSNTHVTQSTDGTLPFYMGFTSGTTGEPKAFIRSHDSWVASFQCNIIDFKMDASDEVLIPGALIHSHFLFGAISTLYLGGTVVLLEKFLSGKALSVIGTHSISTVFVVPTMVHAFLKEEMIVTKKIKMISSGAKWEDNSKNLIANMFLNLEHYEFYGASELSFVTVLNHHDYKLKLGSVGKPCHNVELQIRKINNELANTNEMGKIFVRSKMLFTGYLTQRNSGIHSIQDKDGWVTVDDMGYLDDEGYLYIVGREKNMILYGGINIFPEEIEKVLSSHPDVEEVAVVGLSNDYWGQIAAAVIKGNASKKDLIRHCKISLSSFKIPREWYFIEEMPLTTSGKIARAQLIEELESKVMSH